MNIFYQYIKQISKPFSARWIKRILPKSLFGRTLLIIVTPTLLALIVATFVFFNRHWYKTTYSLTHAVASDISVIVSLLEETNDPISRYRLEQLTYKRMELSLSFYPNREIPKIKIPKINPLHKMLNAALKEKLNYKHAIDMYYKDKAVIVYVKTKQGLYSFVVPSRRIYTPTTEVFIGWMIGSSILLSFIALVFMRNQIRPVRRLAKAAEAIGKGQKVPWFKQEGATEVRQAAASLMIMRDRIRRSIDQRTAMLAGVSHDLRTPLTRMKLQLAMMQENAQTRGFKSDIEDMETMLEAYLSFAKGEEAEKSKEVKLSSFISEIIEPMNRNNELITLSIESDVDLRVRPIALKRCFENILSNALRYASSAKVLIATRDHIVNIFIDDDGEGIPVESRGDVFKPFLRLDKSRNMETGGVGLGLTIARDIARAHGGGIVLEASPMGGLRVRVWLPI